MFVLILDLVEDFHTVEERRLHRIFCGLEGQFAYQSKEALLTYLVEHMPNPNNLQDEERRIQFDLFLSQLKHWKK